VHASADPVTLLAMIRRTCIGLCFALMGCLPPAEAPPPPAARKPPADEQPAPLPPEEQPPAEALAPVDPPNAKPVEPGITTTGAPTRGTLPKAVVDERLKSVGPAVSACYERALKTRPELRGNLSINFVVGTDGKVAHADSGPVDDPLEDAPTVSCILDEIRKLDFPPPSGGRVFLNYPLRLEPQKP
jgi:hypothetical protein